MSEVAAASSSLPGSPESSPAAGSTRRFGDLRGVQWRIDLGVLPSSASFDELRRVTADSRRRYATLRRRLLVNPHVSKKERSSSNLVIDNPLSQNPESSWGRFFQNAELEKMVDQDLLRLYPEDESYFQTPGCQGMLRRILLMWCLGHQDCGYRQGMHELLAPLIYVLQVDINRLAQVRDLYEEHFTDKFDELSVHENDQTYNFDYKRISIAMDSSKTSAVKSTSMNDLDPDVQKFILLSDAYGVEGELGIVLSEKFMEHDVYSMFEALMSGAHGSVAMADFFSHSSVNNGSPPVIEASSALYHLLSIVDSYLYDHLIELGVEPQYFALRWLRVLFGREFDLDNLLPIWDEIFMQDNRDTDKSADSESSFKILGSARGAFIAAFGVSMMLYLRSSLLAAEFSTSALQRLLNFPKNVDLTKLIRKAKSLQVIALRNNSSSMMFSPLDQIKPMIVRAHSLSSDSVSPKSPLLADSYWEEKWRVLQKEGNLEEPKARRRGWSEKFKLYRTESDPSSTKTKNGKKIPRPVRRSLLQDLSRHLGGDEECVEDIILGNEEESTAIEDDSSEASTPPRLDNDSPDNLGDTPLPVSDIPEEAVLIVEQKPEASVLTVEQKPEASVLTVEQKPMPRLGKFQWLWKLRRSSASEEKPDKEEDSVQAAEPSSDATEASVDDGSRCNEIAVISKGDGAADLNVMGTLRNIGHSMLEHIQVIESAFQPDRGQVGSIESFSKNVLVGKGQVTAMTALKELRKISNLLSEM